MSDWRLDLQELARIGGQARVTDWCSTGSGRRDLVALGLVELAAPAPRTSHRRIYRITQRGHDLLDGRLLRVHMGPSPAVWRATWIAALPRSAKSPAMGQIGPQRRF